MIRAPRLALSLLLVLMQCLAPWVHAHTGGETGASPHLPGLEFLAGVVKECAAADSRPDHPDLIVGVQAGKWDRSDKAQPAPDGRSSTALPPGTVPAMLPPPLARAKGQDALVLPPAQGRPTAHPRAPPLRLFFA